MQYVKGVICLQWLQQCRLGGLWRDSQGPEKLHALTWIPTLTLLSPYLSRGNPITILSVLPNPFTPFHASNHTHRDLAYI